MKRSNLMLACVLSIGIIFSSQAATIFSDDFSDSNQTKIKWISQAAASFSLSFSDGSATLKNPDTTYTAFLVHNFTSKPSTFTMSAQITLLDTNADGAGIMYCLDNKSGIKGYTLQFSRFQNLYAYKYSAVSQVLFNKSTSFAHATTNIIQVSKRGDTINVFCNGTFIARYNDASYGSGDIAILVPPKASVKVDNVTMTDQFTPGVTASCFADSFYLPEPMGWNLGLMQGSLNIGANRLVINNKNNTNSSVMFTDGNFQSSSIKTALTSNSGTSLYGATFVSVINGNNGQVSYKFFGFLIDSQRRYALMYPDSTTILIGAPQSFIYGSLGVDTLEVLRFATSYKFKVNGVDIGETIPVPSTYRIDGAGLYVGAQTQATCNYFMVGGDSTTASCSGATAIKQIQVRQITPKMTNNNKSVVYDIMGRKMGNYSKFLLGNTTLKSGSYIVRYTDAKGIVSTRRLIKAIN